MDDLATIYIASVIILLIISALFACLETAITASSRAKIHRLQSEGNKKAVKLDNLMKTKERVISALLAGNNLVNILASALTTSLLVKFFGEVGLIYATVAMTLLVLVFAEILPKTIALSSPTNIALKLTPLATILTKIFAPFSGLVQKVVNFLIKPFMKKPIKKVQSLELDEIRETVDFKANQGAIQKHDKDLIDGVLDLSDTEINEIMVHRKNIESLNIDLPIKELIGEALKISYTRIPLWKDNKENIVKIINVRKLLKALHLNGNKVEDIKLDEVSYEPWFVPDTNTLRSQLFAFRKKKRRFSLLVDEYGSLLGMVTLEDILEEIVGDITQEGDRLAFQVIKTKSGAYKIPGKALIRDINKKLEWNIKEDEDAFNLTAFIIGNLGRIPNEKEKFEIDNYSFEILKKKGQDLVMLKIKKL